MRGGAPPCLAALLKFTRFSFRRDGVRRGRRTQAGAEKSPRRTPVSAPHENQLDGRGGRRHLRAHPSRLHPSARCWDVSSCRVNPFVHPTYSCSAGCWVHSPRTGVPLPGPHSAPLFVSRSPKERARASGRSHASLREPALRISAPCLLRKTVAFAGAVNRNAASVNTPLRSPKPQ